MHLHTGAMTQDLAVEQYSTQKDQHSSHHIGDTIATNWNTAKMQLQTTYLIFVQ